MAWKQFFNVRRLAGLAFLLLSLAICASWVRSLSTVDQIEFEDRVGQTHQLATMSGTISWCRWDRKHRTAISNQLGGSPVLGWTNADWQSAPIGFAAVADNRLLLQSRLWARLGTSTTLGPDTSRLSEGIWGPTTEVRGSSLITRHATILVPLILVCGILLLLPSRRRQSTIERKQALVPSDSK